MMGCIVGKASGSDSEDEDKPVVYSWDKKKLIDPSDFVFEHKTGEELIKYPGSINGQQFTIANCKGCSIYLFDFSAAITIDGCVDCLIFLGAVESSAFVRDCKNCKVIVACQQFRTRNCQDVDVLIHCKSRPIIESSSSMRFGCFKFNYPKLPEQFKQANLDVFVSDWSNIYDFSPAEGNYKFFHNRSLAADSFKNFQIPAPLLTEESVVSKMDSCVPFTYGKTISTSPDQLHKVVLVYNKATEIALVLADHILSKYDDKLFLLYTNVLTFSQKSAAEFLHQSTDPEKDIVQSKLAGGPVISMIFLGNEEELKGLASIIRSLDLSTSVFVSRTTKEGEYERNKLSDIAQNKR